MRTILIFLAAASLLASGCGDDAKPLNSADLTVKADNICAKVELALAKAVTPILVTNHGPVRSPERIDAYGKASEQALSDLRQLTPPKERKATYEAYLKAQAASVEADKPYLQALKKGDDAAQAKLASAVQTTDAASDAAAAKAGIIKCGDPKKAQKQ